MYQLLLFLLFPLSAFAAGDINTTAELLNMSHRVNAECATMEFNNALAENAYLMNENDDRDVVRDWIYDILQSPEALGAVLSCPEVADADETDTIYMPIKYTFPGGRTIDINYETQVKVLEQRFMLATKTELPTNDPNPGISSTDEHATWVNTEPAWYGVMVTQSGALRDFVGPDKNNTVSMKWVEENIGNLYPHNADGWCSTKTGIGAKINDSMVHNVLRNRTVQMEDDDNNYYIAGDRNLKWISVAEVVVDIALTVVSYGGYAALSGVSKGARAAHAGKTIKKSLRVLGRIPEVGKYIEKADKVKKITRTTENAEKFAKSFRNMAKLEENLARAEKGTKKYARIEKQLENARKLHLEDAKKFGRANEFKNIKDLDKIDDLKKVNADEIAKIQKEMAEMARADKNVAEYVKEYDALKDAIKYSRELKAFKNARTGNVITRTWQGAKNIGKSIKVANTGTKTLNRVEKVARQATKSGRARDWLFHSTMRNIGRVARVGEDLAALNFVIGIIGGFYDWADTETDEFTNGIKMSPLLLLSADSIEGQDNVVNYGMWLMWTGNSTNAADDDTAYLQAMDFAQKFYQDLTEVQDESGRHACDVDIYVVRPIIRNPGTDSEELYWLVMNDEPWSTAE
ncbi:MAG: hypothetical protein IJQ90_03155 [Alphaproteobacteria bacterium]|nr:hypothetical protein [Alphaproteobacteria bacterium]